MLFHGRSVNSPLVAAVAHGPTVYNRQPGRIIWLESRGRNDQHQPAVPGPRYCRVQNMGGGRGDICPHPHTQRQLDHLHTFYTSRPSFVGRLSGRRVTRHSSAASIPTSSSASLSSPSPAPSPLSARPDYGRNNWHRSRGVMGVVLLYCSVADQILLWIWGREVARV